MLCLWSKRIISNLFPRHKPDNPRNTHAIAVKRVQGQQGKQEIMGHVPLTLSHVFHLILNHSGQISVEVTGKRRNKGIGWEIPATYTFYHKKPSKIKKLLELIKKIRRICRCVKCRHWFHNELLTEKLLYCCRIKGFWLSLVCFTCLLSRVDICSWYRGISNTCRVLLCVRYNEDFALSRFVISRFCLIHFTITLARLKSIFRYTEDFVT